MTRTLRWLLAALWTVTATAAAADSKELVVFNWSEYLAPDVVEAFEQAYDVDVRVVHYGDDGHRDELMAESDGEGFDVIVVNGSRVQDYRRRGWIQPLELDRLDNLALLDERWLDAFPDTPEYGVPYFWGTIGIAYRSDLVPEPITSWMQLYRPGPALQGRIVMPGTPRDVLGMALKATGHSVNPDSREAMLEAGRLAQEQRPHVAAYSYISVEQESALVNGSAVAAMVYGGDARNVAQHHDAIRYVIPEEGGAVWCDYLTVSSDSANPQLAHRFIDFLNRPEIAARQAEYLYLASPNAAAREHLDPALLEDPIVYPDEQALAKSQFYRPLPTDLQRLQNQIFARLTE